MTMADIPQKFWPLGQDATAEAMNRLAAAIEGVSPHLADIAKNTSVMADNMDRLKSAVRRWSPRLMAALGVLGVAYPKIAQIVQALQVPGVTGH